MKWVILNEANIGKKYLIFATLSSILNANEKFVNDAFVLLLLGISLYWLIHGLDKTLGTLSCIFLFIL